MTLIFRVCFILYFFKLLAGAELAYILEEIKMFSFVSKYNVHNVELPLS